MSCSYLTAWSSLCFVYFSDFIWDLVTPGLQAAMTAPGVCRHIARGVSLNAWMSVCTLHAYAIPLCYELPSSLPVGCQGFISLHCLSRCPEWRKEWQHLDSEGAHSRDCSGGKRLTWQVQFWKQSFSGYWKITREESCPRNETLNLPTVRHVALTLNKMNTRLSEAWSVSGAQKSYTHTWMVQTSSLCMARLLLSPKVK